MTDQILNTILDSSYTLHELRERVRILKSYLSKQLFGSDTTEDDLDIRAQSAWLNGLGEAFFKQFNQNNFSPTFTEIEAKINHLSPLIIYFAFDVTPTELENVGAWLRRNYGPQFIFDHKYDPTLIAGCALVWKGVYRDYSLKTKIEQNQQEIIGVIRNSINTGK
jgi:hypothetical protein